MKLPVAAFTAALTLGLASAPAAAGTYIGLGIGSEAPLTGTLGDSFSTDDSTHGRLVVGKRFGALALEGSIFGTEMASGAADAAAAAVGVDLKYHLGLGAGFEAYLKGGLHKAWLQSDTNDVLDQYEGTGYQYGAGLQYQFDLAVSSAALWLDYNRTQLELTDEGRAPIQGTAKLLTIGVSLGF